MWSTPRCSITGARRRRPDGAATWRHALGGDCGSASPVGLSGDGGAWDTTGVLAAFSITPLGADQSVGDLVAEAVRIVRASGLPNETNAMFTNIEGEWDEVMAVIKECTELVGRAAGRASLVIKIDYRPGSPDDRMRAKVEAVERRLA